MVRHGESVANVLGVIAGPKGCAGLSPHGIHQAEALRERLARTGEISSPAGSDPGNVAALPSGIVLQTSILPRAIETARILAPVLGVQQDAIEQDCGWCELHPGVADGLSLHELEDLYGAPDMIGNPDRPLAPGAESWTSFRSRVMSTIDRVVSSNAGAILVVVCHAGVIEASLLGLLGVAGASTRIGMRPANCSLTEWELSGSDHRWRLVRYNDAAHLA
ncbi:MAG: histidine phosphatase family protein [Actinobacteria bacterium]|nr:histidine phosphatase family protein [Actinomycetota bacterium]